MVIVVPFFASSMAPTASLWEWNFKKERTFLAGGIFSQTPLDFLLKIWTCQVRPRIIHQRFIASFSSQNALPLAVWFLAGHRSVHLHPIVSHWSLSLFLEIFFDIQQIIIPFLFIRSGPSRFSFVLFPFIWVFSSNQGTTFALVPVIFVWKSDGYSTVFVFPVSYRTANGFFSFGIWPFFYWQSAGSVRKLFFFPAYFTWDENSFAMVLALFYCILVQLLSLPMFFFFFLFGSFFSPFGSLFSLSFWLPCPVSCLQSFFKSWNLALANGREHQKAVPFLRLFHLQFLP